MVSFKKLATAAAVLVGIVCAAPAPQPDLPRAPAAIPTTLAVKARSALPVVGESDTYSLEARDNRPKRLWYAAGGEIAFMLGSYWPLPQELSNLIAGHDDGAPGQLLLRNFVNWVEARRGTWGIAADFIDAAIPQMGAVWGGGQPGQRDYGWAIVFNNIPASGPLRDSFMQVVHAAEAWASQGGAAITAAVRANGFLDPGQIGGGRKRGIMGGASADAMVYERSRDDQCPADYDVLSIAKVDVPDDLDFNRVLKWTDKCP